MIYPTTLASLPSSPFHVFAEYLGNRYYVRGVQNHCRSCSYSRPLRQGSP